MSTPQLFQADIERLAKALKEDVSTVARATIVELFNGIIKDTRVDTGRLRGNWQVSLDNPVSTQTDRLDTVPQGSPGGAAQADVLATVQAGRVNWLSNNLPYAEVWEERDGMARRNIARLERTIEQEARRVRR